MHVKKENDNFLKDDLGEEAKKIVVVSNMQRPIIVVVVAQYLA